MRPCDADQIIEKLKKFSLGGSPYMNGMQTGFNAAIGCLMTETTELSDEAQAQVRLALLDLNFYRNLYYAEPEHTEQGKVARALNVILPVLAEIFVGGEDDG